MVTLTVKREASRTVRRTTMPIKPCVKPTTALLRGGFGDPFLL